jgi:hypothetical protein
MFKIYFSKMVGSRTFIRNRIARDEVSLEKLFAAIAASGCEVLAIYDREGNEVY